MWSMKDSLQWKEEQQSKAKKLGIRSESVVNTTWSGLEWGSIAFIYRVKADWSIAMHNSLMQQLMDLEDSMVPRRFGWNIDLCRDFFDRQTDLQKA